MITERSSEDYFLCNCKNKQTNKNQNENKVDTLTIRQYQWRNGWMGYDGAIAMNILDLSEATRTEDYKRVD